MMCRSATTASVLLSLMQWGGDCIVIDTAKSKSDQTGEKEFPRHIYANPLKPWCCPFLSLAVYIFSLPFRTEGDDQLFPGSCQEDRFGKILQSVVEELPDMFLNQLGANPSDIATHSTRKGSASYVLSHVGGPNVIQVFLRCCWSLGNVQDRYIFLDAGGDQFVGRTVSGLPMSDSKFATLPPHFHPKDFSELTETGWEVILPRFRTLPSSFQGIIPFLFASIVYHVEYLENMLSPQHPIFQSTIFTRGYVEKYRGTILVGEGVCPVTGMAASGVPQNVRILYEIEQLKAGNAAVKAEMQKMKEDIIEAVTHSSNCLPEKLAAHLFDNFTINGMTPVTVDRVQSIVNEMKIDILSALERRANGVSEEKHEETSCSPPPVNVPLGFSTHFWCNPRDKHHQPKPHPVPKGFVLPRASCANCWMLWHFGNTQQNIAPYSSFRKDDLDLNAEAQQLSKIRCVMDSILAIAVKHNFVGGNIRIRNLCESEAQELFAKAFPIFLSELYNENSNASSGAHITLGNQSISTLYQLKKRTEALQRKKMASAEEELPSHERLITI